MKIVIATFFLLVIPVIAIVRSLMLRSRWRRCEGKIIGFCECIDWINLDRDEETYISGYRHFVPLVTYIIDKNHYVGVPLYNDHERIFEIAKPVPLLYDPKSPSEIYVDQFILPARPRRNHARITPEMLNTNLCEYILSSGFQTLILDYVRIGGPGDRSIIIHVFISGSIAGNNPVRLFSLVDRDRVFLYKLAEEIREFSNRHDIGFVNKLENDGYCYQNGKLLRYAPQGNLKEFSFGSWRTVIDGFFQNWK